MQPIFDQFEIQLEKTKCIESRGLHPKQEEEITCQHKECWEGNQARREYFFLGEFNI